MTDSKYAIPETVSPDYIFDMFINKACGKDEIYINGQPLKVSVNYRITDPKYIKDSETKKTSRYGIVKNYEKKETAILPEIEGQYTESPVIMINDVSKFKQALFNYIKAYIKNEGYWTCPDIAENWEQATMYTMQVLWTNATIQDFSNPVKFLERYTTFLEQDQWEDLKEPQKVKNFGKAELYKIRHECYSEMEAPHNYSIYAREKDGKLFYLPSIVYGIKDDTAYIYAVQRLYTKTKEPSEDVKKLRKLVRGKGIEPLGIIAMLSFIKEAKNRGIKQINMPANLIMQYTTKNKIIAAIHGVNAKEVEQEDTEYDFNYDVSMEKQIQKMTEEIQKIDDSNKKEQLTEKISKLQTMMQEIDKLDDNHKGSMDRRLLTLMQIATEYSTGIKFVEIPGEGYDNLVADIQHFEIGNKVKDKQMQIEEEMI